MLKLRAGPRYKNSNFLHWSGRIFTYPSNDKMQTAGGLKKKRKRNLAKVTGLTAIQYEEKFDRFDIHEMYQDEMEYNFGTDFHLTHINIHPKSGNGTGEEPNLTNKSSYYSRPNSSRVTRDPRFSISASEIDSNYTTVTKSRAVSSTQSNLNSNTKREACPVLIDEILIPRLRSILILGIFSCALPWKWNKKTYQIDKFSQGFEKIWKVIWTILAFQSVFITMFQIYSFGTRMHVDADGSYRPIFMNSFSVLWYSYAITLNICMYIYRDRIRWYINTLLTINKKYVEKYLIDMESYSEIGKVFTNVSVRTNMTQVFISICLFLVMPFQPWYLYSYVYAKDQPWYFLIPGALQEFIVIGQILAVYLLIGWIVVAHCNSVIFWLQESHNHNDTGSTTDDLRRPEKALEIYRSLQVLTAIFNDVMAPLALPLSKLINWTALIPCGFVLIRSMNQKFIDEFPGILTYPFGVIDCVTCAFGVLQVSASMFDIASSFLTSWSMTKQKNLRRVLISCRTLKVKVGDYYNVSVSTTVTFFKSCFDYIIDTIITFR